MGQSKRSRLQNAIWLICIPLLLMASMLSGREAIAAAPSLTATCDSAALAVCVNDTTFGNGAYVVISGTGLDPGKFVATWLDSNGSNGLDQGEPMVKAVTDASGAFSIPLHVTDVPAGAQQIRAGVCPNQSAGDVCLGTTGQVSTMVTIALTTSPFRFGSGSTIDVSGAGVGPGTTLNVWFDNNGNSVLDPGEATTSATASASGSFTAKLKASDLPGNYFIRAGPAMTATSSSAVDIANCWFQECFIDGADTICLIGTSPTDFRAFFPDCKKIDTAYTDPTPATPNGGYDLSNRGPRFVGAGSLAAATNDLGIAPLTGCGPIQVAIAIARAYGNVVPDADYDVFKPLTDLTDIGCGDPVLGVPPIEFATYLSLETVAGNPVPDSVFLLALITAIHAAAAAAAVAAIAVGFAAVTLGPVATTAALGALAGVAGLDPGTISAISGAIGAAVVAAGVAAFAAAPLLVAAILLVAQQALALAAVVGAIACGHVNYYCDGADITANILAKPQLQQALIPIPFMQPPIHPAPSPNPCRASVTSPFLNGTCWGEVIGWARVSCKGADQHCETAGAGLPKLAVPGSAGPNNLGADYKCITGKVVGLSIGYDGDVSLDVYDDSILPLLNYHNFQPGPGGTEPPNGMDIEIPLADRGQFLPDIQRMRPGMIVHICGWWVADMHMLWNEIHPVVTLAILSDTSVGILSPAAHADLPSGTTTVTGSITDIGAPDTHVCTVQWDAGAPTAATVTVDPTSSTPGTCVATTTGLAPGPHTATVSVQDGDSSTPATASVAFTINAPPVLSLPGPQSVQYGTGMSYSVSASDPEPGDTLTLGATGLPAGITFTDTGGGTGSLTVSPQLVAGVYNINFTAMDGVNAPVSGSLAITVTPKPASISAVAASKVYGDSDPALTTISSGFLPADLGGGKITFSATRAAGENVGNYAITPAADDHGTHLLNNYSVTPNGAAFTISPKPATISAVAAGKLYGSPDPVLMATGSGFLASDLGDTKITVGAFRAAGEAVGTYTITPAADDHGSGLLSNYSLTTNQAVFTITVTPASLCNLTKLYLQSSNKYAALSAAAKAEANFLADRLCVRLAMIASMATPRERAAAIVAYGLAVDALVRYGWLTAAQATFLKNGASAL